MVHDTVVRAFSVIILLLFFFRAITAGANSKHIICNPDPPSDDSAAIELNEYSHQTTWLFNQLESDQSDNQLHLTLGGHQLSVELSDKHVAGLKVTTQTGGDFSVSAFGGLPTTPVKDKGVVENLIYGGKIAAQPISACDIGLSFMRDNRQNNPDEIGVDFSFDIGSRLTLSGLSKNKENEDDQWHEHDYSARLRFGSFRVEPAYQYFYSKDYSDRYETQSHLYGFLKGNSQMVSIAGTDLNWKGPGVMQIGLRGRRYNYTSRDEKAYYYAGLLSLKKPSGNRIGLEVGRMEGRSPETTYSLLGADLYCRNLFGRRDTFFSADFLYIDYDTPVYDQDNALSASLGVGLSFLNGRLETRLSSEYKTDPYSVEDLGVLLSIQFRP